MKTELESFEDIIFENRNKNYGAYELRRKYSKRGTIALMIAITIISFAVGGPLIAGMMDLKFIPPGLDSLTGVEFTEIPKDEPEPLPELPKQDEKVKPPVFTVPNIVDDIEGPEVEFASNDEIAEGANSNILDPSSDNIVYVEPPKNDIKVDETVHNTYAIQEPPIFKGGDAALLKYVAEHTKYPVPALEQGIEGTVHIRFVVTKTGEIGKVEVLRSIDPLLSEEAVRVVKTLPKWTPGKNNGHPVNVWFVMPVKFQLK